MVETLLLSATPVRTYGGQGLLTNASGFFFERGERLFLITSRHVLREQSTNHSPHRIEIDIHIDPLNVTAAIALSIQLYRDGIAVWREGLDSAGAVDVAAVELDRGVLPRTMVYRAFNSAHLYSVADAIEVGDGVLIVGFPLGFHDSLHHLPVVRQASIASSFGFRFQGCGYFLTDARTHRGTSGAPVVKRSSTNCAARGDLRWTLLGVHAARFDLQGRDAQIDEGLGLNSAWYADILLKLTS